MFHQLAVFTPGNHRRNYRIPDVLVIDPRHVLEDGTEGPVVLAIEVLSPDDESRAKLPFYAARGVQELWLVDPDARATEVHVLREGAYVAVPPDRAGTIHAPALDLALTVIDGPRLRLAGSGGVTEI